ncbi:hypothetical protein E6H24_04325 [Candidatus Bathyarchaeota archaeon]|nr:MAG: hypothetical protein E6H24_04325 [Candidatus Bathyarchaeota archaeon]
MSEKVPAAEGMGRDRHKDSRLESQDCREYVNLGDIAYPGSFGLTVRYQNQEYGPYSPDAATNSTYTVQVNAGSSTTTTGTAIVLLVIFGIAFFLILLAIKVRKPATPPKI